jgi:hypothetical protein
MIKCPRCKIEKDEQSFKSIRGKTLRYCLGCRETSRKYMVNSHCPCGKRKNLCLTHGGSLLCPCGKRKVLCLTHGGQSMCPCGKQKSQCKLHGGQSLCSCGIQRNNCKIHGTTSICPCGKIKYVCKTCGDPIKLTIRNMINNSKHKDIKKNKYDANNFIDKCFIQSLIEELTKCFYCDIQMQFIENDDTLCTIERLDNRIGHIKSNCVLACRKCNYSNIGHP